MVVAIACPMPPAKPKTTSGILPQLAIQYANKQINEIGLTQSPENEQLFIKAIFFWQSVLSA